MELQSRDAQISEVQRQITRVGEQIDAIAEKIDEAEQAGDEERRTQLHKEKISLLVKENQLRAEELQLMRIQDGAKDFFFFFCPFVGFLMGVLVQRKNGFNVRLVSSSLRLLTRLPSRNS